MKKNLKFNLTKRERAIADYWYTIGCHQTYMEIYSHLLKTEFAQTKLSAKINNLAIKILEMEEKAKGGK